MVPSRRPIRRAAAILILLGCGAGACDGDSTRPGGGPPAAITTLDAGQLAIGVAGPGTFAYNPLTGGAAAEFVAGTGKHVLAGGGLWLSARVDGAVRSTITECSVEYVRGTVASDPGDPRFRVYKVTDGDPPDAPDVAAWPAELGAPVDSLGQPAVPASGQIVWTLFHDADRDGHHILFGAGLAAEVRQSLITWRGASPLDRTVAVRWRITNRSASAWQDLYVGFWVDAELGGFADDVCGSDSTLGLGYVYNHRDHDTDYGGRPPAAGIALLAARDEAGPLPLAPTFNVWVNGEDPETESEARHLLTGRDRAGEPRAHALAFPGDPNAPGPHPAGSLDTGMGDKRMLMAAGPYAVAAGAWLELDALLIAAQAPGQIPRLASVAALKADFTAARAALGYAP